MKRLRWTSAAALALMAGTAAAAQVGRGLSAQGFARFKVTTGPTQVKIKACRGSPRVELCYDQRTGKLLEDEVSRVATNDDDLPPMASGIGYDTDDEDFIIDDDPPVGDDDDDDAGEDDHGENGDGDGSEDDEPRNDEDGYHGDDEAEDDDG